MIASEAAYFDGYHVQHIADWERYQRNRERHQRLIHMMDRYCVWERKYTDALMLDVRHVIERADRAIGRMSA